MAPPTLHTRFTSTRTAAAAALLLSALAAGCVSDPGPMRGPLPPLMNAPTQPGAAPQPWTPDPAAHLPERLRIHPLSRLTQDETGQQQLALHLELKDRFGHNIKALGWLRIELTGARQRGLDDQPPGADDDGRPRNVYWEVDLRDPEQNALMYDDLISRTYLVYLGGLPGWVERWAAGESGLSIDPWLNLHATFVAHDQHGNDRVLRASHRLER